MPKLTASTDVSNFLAAADKAAARIAIDAADVIHTHVSADITDATDGTGGTVNEVLLKTNSDGDLVIGGQFDCYTINTTDGYTTQGEEAKFPLGILSQTYLMFEDGGYGIIWPSIGFGAYIEASTDGTNSTISMGNVDTINLNAPLLINSGGLFTDYINDKTYGLTAINVIDRRLLSSSGYTVAGWDDYGFKFGWDGSSAFYHTLDTNGINTPNGLTVDISNYNLTPASGSPSLNWDSRTTYDYSNVLSLNWDYRYTADYSATTSIDWGNRYLYDSLGATAIDWDYRTAWDYSNLQSIDWQNRQLIASDGMTVALDWSTAGSLNLYNNTLNGGNIGYDVLGAYGGGGASYDPIFENTNGRFFNVDGYASRSAAVTLTPNTVSALTATEGTISYVNDADTPVIGVAVVGGGSAKCLVCYNGTDHIVTALL